MQKYLELSVQFLKRLFGDFSYSKPDWLRNIFDQISIEPKKIKKTGLAVASTIVLAGAGLGLKKYLDSRPKIDAVSITVSSIAPYNFEKPESRSLTIIFSKSVANINMIGKTLNDEIKLRPAIKGQWLWASDNELKFTPLIENGKLDWEIGQKYKGHINKKILAANTVLENEDFEFSVENLKAELTQASFYQDPRFPENKKVISTFKFNYPVEPESLKKRLQLAIEGGFNTAAKPELSISFDEKKSQAFIQTSNIKIDNDNKEFKINLDKGYSSLFGGIATESSVATVKVPSLYDYFIIKNSQIVIVRNDKFESEQILRFENVSEIASEELLKSIEIYELPFKNDDYVESNKTSLAFPWQSVSEVTPAVLTKSKKLSLGLIPSEESISLNHSFQITAKTGRAIYIKILKNTTSFGGFKLKDDYESVLTVPAYPSDLQIMGKGSLLPLSGSKKLSLVSRNVNKIAFDLHQIRIEQINHLIPELMSDFSKPDIYNLRPDQISEKTTSEISLINKNPQKSQFSSIDLSNYLGGSSGQTKKGLFLVSVRSKNSSADVSDQRFIILSDIGIIAKKNVAGNYEVYIQNISTGLPVPSAKVSVLGQNGLNVLSAETNSEGVVSFPNLKDFKNDKQPIAFVAQLGESISFVPYDAYSREVDLTQFDIGGVRDNSESDQLNAFIFSDRGIYRPGEKADFGLVVRSKNWSKAFSQIPIDIVVQNPSGQDVFKETIKVSSNSMESISFKSEDYFQTGFYTIYASIKKSKNEQLMLGSQTFQMEEFLPDQIKVRTSLSQSNLDGWVNPKDLKLNLSAFSLYGKPASDRLAKSKLRMRAAEVYFSKWKDFSFNSIKNAQIEINDSLPDQKTNNDGEAEWNINLDNLEKSVYRLNVDSEVFETEGGKSVKSQLSQLISTQSYFLGFKTQLLDLSFIKKDAEAQIEIVTINSKLESVAQKNINIEIIEKKPTSVLTKLPNDTYAYQTVFKENLIKTSKINSSAKNTILKLETQTVGEFILVFKDDEKNELNRLVYNVVGSADLDRGLEKSSILKLGLNKKDYKQNEEIEIQIKAPYAGAGLITIERDKVYSSKWFKSNGKSTIEKIQIPPGLEGQAYVVVTMLRDQKSEDIYTSPLAYGAASFAIDLESRKSKIEIQVPNLIKPGQLLTYKIKSEQKTKAAVYLVDEGILQVAQYKLPQPLSYFFQKKALQVNTYQILDLVLPDFSQLKSSAAGGDESAKLGQSINPFKRKNIAPVTYWQGIVDLNSSYSAFTYKVPDHFNGNLKLMVVTADEKKLGSHSADINVRGDFIINATATTFTAPGDEFEINLIIANQLKGSGIDAKIELNIQTGNSYVLMDKINEFINISENKEKSFNFRLKAKDTIGSNPVTIMAGINNNKAKIELNISNRPASVYFQNLDWLIVKKDPLKIKTTFLARPELKKNMLQVHTTVQDLIKPFEQFYETNDYLCTEQIASQLMLLVLKNEKMKTDTAKFSRLISLLRARQQSSGSFVLYPNDNLSSPEASLHLGMIFLYMQEKGEPVPQDIWQRYLNGLKNDYDQVQTKLDLYHKAKSIYILTRSQYIPKTELKNMTAIMNDKNTQNDIAPITAYYLAASYRLTQQDESEKNALRLAEKNKPVKFNDNFIFEDSEYFEIASLQLRHFENQKNNLFDSSLISRLIDTVNLKGQNTYSTSYLLMSLDTIFKQASSVASLEKIDLKYFDKNKKEIISDSEIKFNDKVKKIDLLPSVDSVSISNDSLHPVLMTYTQAGFKMSDVILESFQGIEISKIFENTDGNSLKNISVGDEINVKIRARLNKKNETSKSISALISDLLPSGFEVVMTSVRQNKLDSNDASENKENESSEADFGEESKEELKADESQEGAHLKIWDYLLPRTYAANNSPALSSDTHVAVMSPALVDVREDRINLYATLTENITEYTYRIKAISKGRFIVPGIYARGMYRTDLAGQGGSSFIDVK